MPASLTIFAAQNLVYIDLALAAVVLAFMLYRRPRSAVPPWVLTVAIMLVISVILAGIGGAVYNDPRPFVVDHNHPPPLIHHAADNGFPSDHALLAAAIVGAVALLNLWSALPFVVLAVLIDWARVGAGIHHVGDVIGSSLFVALALALSLLATPFILRWLEPYIPPGWRANRKPAPTTRTSA
jgi:undecaprenyl-diphosphatase